MQYTVLSLAIASLFTLAASGAPRATANASPAASPPAASEPDALLSRRALRLARLAVQLRWLELRRERLACVRAALERELPPELRPADPSPKPSCPP